MELRHLRYFVTVAEELHFGRAAERLQISQQPLSVQIRRLEDELGVTLFHRTTRHVELTEAGTIFLEKAQQTLQLADQAVDAAREAERGERGKIVVGYITTVLYNVLPQLVRSFREAFPHIHITLRELCSPELETLVMQGDLDVGLNGKPLLDDGLACFALHRESFVVVLPEDHPLAARGEIALQDLANQPFIQYDRIEKRQVHDDVVSFFHQANVPLNAVQEASNELALISLAAAGIGVSVVTQSAVMLRQAGVVYRPLVQPSVDVEFNLIWRRDSPSPVVRSFIRLARAQSQLGRSCFQL